MDEAMEIKAYPKIYCNEYRLAYVWMEYAGYIIG